MGKYDLKKYHLHFKKSVCLLSKVLLHHIQIWLLALWNNDNYFLAIEEKHFLKPYGKKKPHQHHLIHLTSQIIWISVVKPIISI